MISEVFDGIWEISSLCRVNCLYASTAMFLFSDFFPSFVYNNKRTLLQSLTMGLGLPSFI